MQGGIYCKGYKAVTWGLVLAKEFVKNTSWCYSAGETIALFDPDFSNDIGQ